MLHFFRRIGIALVGLTTSLSACEPTTPSNDEKSGDIGIVREQITVGPDILDCKGVAPMKCMLVNGALFHEAIEGFVHTPGTSYVLEVERSPRFPEGSLIRDASPFSYRLIRVLSTNP